MKTTILSTYIYRCNLGDCTNGGLSAKVDFVSAYLGSERTDGRDGSDAKGLTMEQAKALAPTLNENCMVIVEDVCCSHRRLRAIPAALIVSGKWTMFGGNFLHTSDSRFFESPVKIHDRVEN